MRILSAMQPSGQLHLGNYFGSMKPNLELHAGADASFFFIVDLHALTTVQDADLLRRNKEEAILDYLACGYDAPDFIVFNQSDVPAHAELMWILSTVTPMSLLSRAVSYKEKVEKGIPASAGLFLYPVLMAADILLYHADTVPVGRDQKQHVEMARDIAIKFNNVFGEVFTVPGPVIREGVAVVPGTDGQKMSKSYGNTIPLFAEEKAIERCVMGIVTDSKGARDPKDPGRCAVYQIHKLLLPAGEAETLADAYRDGLPYGEAKKKLLADYLDYFSPMRAKRAELTAKDARAALARGAKKASAIAGETMETVRKAVGLR